MARLPSTRQLRYLVALSDHLHFARAAASCHVSQSAFSVAIQELESTLDAHLVDRTNKRVTMTPIGREVATRARQCLQDLEALAELARAAREPLSGRLTLGVIPTIAPFLLPRALPSVQKRYPRLQLYLREDVTTRLHAALLDGTIDLILVALPYDLPGTETVVLFRDRFRLACRAGTALVDPQHYDARRLTADSVLLLEDGHCLRNHALSACKLRDRGKINRYAASSLSTLLQMVDADLGVTFLPEMAEGSALLRGTHIRTYALADSSYREIGLAWRKGSARGEEFRQLGELLRPRHAQSRSG